MHRRTFCFSGDSVYFIDQNQQATLTQVEKMRERGWQVTGFVGDVAEKQALEEFAALVLREHPEGIHCLINNACLMREVSFLTVSMKIFCMCSVWE